jgi:hypothetical protein
MRNTARNRGVPQQCKGNKEEKEKLHKICHDYKAKRVTAVHSPADVAGVRPVPVQMWQG